jgi:tyrosyl-tRNA synthetase
MDNRAAVGPEELRAEIREERAEMVAEASAEISEELSALEAEAQVRSDVRMEEAERWQGVDTSEPIVHEIMTRGVVDVIVRDELEKALRSGRKLRVKLGIDPTGPLLHVGRSVPLFKLRQFQKAGHQVVLIIGDGTALVGDASDKDAERPLLTSEQIEQNMATYKEQVGRVLDLEQVEFRYNGDWLLKLGLKDLIRLASKFTVAQMIQRENFSDRWDQGKPIGLHEIMYPLMQGFDSVAINSDLELGGTDQLFNLMAGRELQEEFGQPPQGVMTMQMIPGTDGRKMSTSWGNAVWILDEAREQFGKIMSMGDHVIPVYMESVTTMPMDEVERTSKGLEDGTVHPMEAKKRLAWEIVNLYHGQEAADRAKADFEAQFQQRGLPSDVPEVPLARALSSKATENGEIGILDLLINTGLAPNRKQAQRLVEQGGVRLDDERVTDRAHMVKPVPGMVLKAGRSFVRIGD